MVNKAIIWAKKRKRKLFIFKVDFDMAFDSLNWSFLDNMMCLMGFGEKWRSWIFGCISSARVFVLVNGNPTKQFSIQRGVRQGDPISSFLFIIAIEGLSVSINEAIDKNIFKGVTLPNIGLTLLVLQHATDDMFLGE